MKVLQINTVCGSGSTGRIATDIHDRLIFNENDGWIAYGRGKSQRCNNSINIGSDLSLYLHVFMTRFFDLHGFGSVRNTKLLIKKINVIKPDVIHLHNLHGYYLNISLLMNYLKDCRIPIVWTLHDCWSFTGHCSYYTFIECTRWQNGCFECPQKKKYPKSILLDRSKWNYFQKKRLFQGVSKLNIVCVSEWLQKQVSMSFLSDYKQTVIYNGINFDLFQITEDLNDFKQKYFIDSQKIILGVADGWDERKGLNSFISLADYISNEYLIVLIGLSDSQLKNLPNNVLGFKKTSSQVELAKFYSAADVFLNLSTEETFGLVTVEAMACGTPVIGLNSTATPELINESNGLVIENSKPEEILKAIKKLEEMNLLSINIRESVSNFSIEEMCKSYMSLYNEVVKE